MNVKELEALVIAQGEELKEARRQLGAVHEQMSEMRGNLDGLCDKMNSAVGDVQRLQVLMGADQEDGPFFPELKALREKLEDVTAKVEGRNKSAAVKRNMTDQDALKVLNGEHKDVGHKEVAEMIGLTYAQVYSCRLGFTFKHVHRDLEKAGWKSPWSKG